MLHNFFFLMDMILARQVESSILVFEEVHRYLFLHHNKRLMSRIIMPQGGLANRHPKIAFPSG